MVQSRLISSIHSLQELRKSACSLSVYLQDFKALTTIIMSAPGEVKANPWGMKTNSVVEQPTSFADVMSEDLAQDLQSKEEMTGFPREEASVPEVDLVHDFLDFEDQLDVTNDAVIAQMLQIQFDREYDRDLDKVEAKYNGHSKVSVSYSNYRMIPEGNVYGSDSEEDAALYEDDKNKSWDAFEETEKEAPVLPKCGYKKQGDAIITKHDSVITGRKNACKVMEFPPGIETGDGGGFDMQLSNKVYNNLKVYSMSEGRRLARLHDKEEKSTSIMALDQKTRLMLHKMVDNQMLERINGTVSSGKEAIILHAEGGVIEGGVVPKECAVKVFKTTLNKFKTRDKYIKDDYRFRDRFSKQNPRKVVHMWAEKEMHNLMRMRQSGINVPEVVQLKKHVLVMSFLGQSGKAAPQLKNVTLSDSQWQEAFRETKEMMHRLYRDCHLVHADLSEYNILWHEDKCWFIDVSQSVEPSHPHALEFLYRDCQNITNFFDKKGIKKVSTAKQLFTSISGLELHGTDADILSEIQNFESNEEVLTFASSEKTYPFDFCWAQSQLDKDGSRNKSSAGKKSIQSPSQHM